MQIIVSQQQLLQAVEAINLVPGRAGIVPSEFIQIEKKNNKLYFSLAAEVYGKTWARSISSEDGDWIFHVDRTSFTPFIQVSKEFRKPPDFKLSLEKKKDSKVLIVKSGKRKVVFNAITFIQGYPSYKSSDAVAIPLNKQQKQLLQLASRFATSDPTLSYIHCIYMLKEKAILASNRISLFFGENKELPITVPLPVLLLKLLEEKIVKGIEVGKHTVKLVLSCGAIYQAINATAKTDFPVKQITKQFKRGKDYPLQFKVKARTFIHALVRLEACVNNSTQREIIVTAKGIKGESKLTLYTDSPQGRFTEVISLASSAKSSFTAEWLLPFLTSLDPYTAVLGTLTTHWDDSAASPYHFTAPCGIELMLSRRV